MRLPTLPYKMCYPAPPAIPHSDQGVSSYKLEALTGPATLVLALGTLALALISYRTMIELREASRAFIGPHVDLTTIRDPSNNVDVWRIVISLENAGNTPAQNVHWIYTGGIDFTPDPEHQEISVTPILPSAEGYGVVLPKGNDPIIDNIITKKSIEKVIRG